MTAHDPGPPTVAEIAALTARLQALSHRGGTDTERAAFLADKDALLARIPDAVGLVAADRQDNGTAGVDDGHNRPSLDRADADGWFSGGYDSAHQAHLDTLGQVDADIALPLEMVDGIEERRTGPVRPDDPAALAARLADLRARVTDAHAAKEVGTPHTRWETVSAAQAAHELTRRGTDPATARAAVAEYLREVSELADAPADEWGLDQGDVDAIAAAHQLPVAASIAADQDDVDAAARAAQLDRWHTDDHTPDTTDQLGDQLDEADAHSAGWSR